MTRQAHVTALLAAVMPFSAAMIVAPEGGPATVRASARVAMPAAPGAPALDPAGAPGAAGMLPEGVVALDAEILDALARRDADHLQLDGFPLGPGRTADLSLARVDPLRHASVVIASVGDDGTIRESNLLATGSPIWAGRVDG
ncbi:MAG: hypothetical protein FGM37_08905, partial [Phycisphaerales bacterium]|nr:hypothetical protein [Phycisphaerales bacterium]